MGTLLRTITAISAIIFLICACALDSKDWAGWFVGMMLSGLWMIFSAWLAGAY